MNKFDVHDILRAVIIALLTLLSWIASQIHSEQVNIANRLRDVELNQAKIMAILQIEPHSSSNETGLFLSDFSH